MITLAELINATTWPQPQDHVKVFLWSNINPLAGDTRQDEFEEIELNVRTLAQYSNYQVFDIDVERDEDGLFLFCSIWKN